MDNKSFPAVHSMDPEKADAHHKRDNLTQKELRDVAAIRDIAPDIPLEEVLESHADEDKEAVKRLVRKIDWRLVPILALLYTWAFLDRGNLGNVNIAGAGKDLGLKVGNRYTIIVMIFFVGYIVIDYPSQIIMRQTSPAIWLGSITVAWGAVSIGQGFVYSWGALAVCRVLLGLLEGGLVPGCIYLLSIWYVRFEVHKRIAAFYSLGIASNGISGLLAYGIEKMEGDASIRGWRWIFIIEGSVTCFCGLLAYLVIVDFPDRATHRGLFGLLPPFLNKHEAAIVLARIERDRGDTVTEKINLHSILTMSLDWKLWEFAAFVCLNNIGLYAFSYFLPVILNDGFGYSVARAQVLTFPPYAAGVPWMFFVAWFGDRWRVRGHIIVFNCILYIIGIAMIGYCTDVHARYGGVFLAVMGINANIPTNFAYMQNNIVGNTKKALASAMMIGGGGCGGIIAGNAFQSADAPDYRPGLITCIVAQAVTILIVVKNFYVFTKHNRKAARGEMIIEGQPGFRYTL